VKPLHEKIIKIIAVCMLPIFAYLAASAILKSGTTVCLWKNLFHTNCLGCGMTRAFYALCHFKFEEAMNYNSKIFVIAVLLFYIWIKEIIKICRGN